MIRRRMGRVAASRGRWKLPLPWLDRRGRPSIGPEDGRRTGSRIRFQGKHSTRCWGRANPCETANADHRVRPHQCVSLRGPGGNRTCFGHVLRSGRRVCFGGDEVDVQKPFRTGIEPTNHDVVTRLTGRSRCTPNRQSPLCWCPTKGRQEVLSLRSSVPATKLPIVDWPLCLGETPAPFTSRSPGIATLGPSCTPSRQLGLSCDLPTKF